MPEHYKRFSLNLQRNNITIPSCLAFVEAHQYQSILADVNAILHPNEIDYYQKLVAEKRKLSFLLGRCAAKIAVSNVLNEPDLTKIEIGFGTFEQPLVNHSSFGPPDVSISHCENVAMAIAMQQGHVMGIDIEKIDFSKTHVFKSQITDGEAEKSTQNFEDERIGFHMIWTAKESLSKALKCGLTVPFDLLQIDTLTSLTSTNDVYELSYKNFAQYKCVSWYLDNHLLSIALPRKTDLPVDIKEQLIFKEINLPNDPPV